jgi:hypothetical protein
MSNTTASPDAAKPSWIDYRAKRGEELHINGHGGRWFKTLGEGA